MALFADDFEGAAGPLTGRVIASGVWGESGSQPSFELGGDGMLTASALACENRFAPADVLLLEEVTFLAFEVEIHWDGTPLSDSIQFGLHEGGGCWIYAAHFDDYPTGEVRLSAGSGATAEVTLPLNAPGSATLRAEFDLSQYETRSRLYLDNVEIAQAMAAWRFISGAGPASGRMGKSATSYSSFRIGSVGLGIDASAPERPPQFWTNLRRTHEIR